MIRWNVHGVFINAMRERLLGCYYMIFSSIESSMRGISRTGERVGIVVGPPRMVGHVNPVNVIWRRAERQCRRKPSTSLLRHGISIDRVKGNKSA